MVELELFVFPEIAILAKEKGFIEPCIAIYQISDDEEDETRKWNLSQFNDYEFPMKSYPNLWNNFNDGHLYQMSAPMYSQIIDWFKKIYNIQILEACPIPPEAIVAHPSLALKEGHVVYLYNKNWNPRIYKNDFVDENLYKALNKSFLEAFTLI